MGTLKYAILFGVILTVVGCATTNSSDLMKDAFNQVKQRRYNQAARMIEENGKGFWQGKELEFTYNENGEEKRVWSSRVRLLVRGIQQMDIMCANIIETKESFLSENNECVDKFYSGDTLNYDNSECQEKIKGNIQKLDDCKSDGRFGSLIAEAKGYSGVNLSGLIKRHEKGIDKVDAELRTYKSSAEMKWLERLSKRKEKENLEKQKQAEMRELMKTPEYKKCKLKSDIVSNQKMVKLWSQSIFTIKKDSKEAGFVTRQMASEMDKAIGMRKGYLLRIEQDQKDLKNYKSVNVSDKKCKELVEDFGWSHADQYL